MATIEFMPTIAYRPSSHKLEGEATDVTEVEVSWSVRNTGNAPAAVVLFISPKPDLPAGVPSNGGKAMKVDPGATVNLQAFFPLTRAGSITLYAIIWDHTKKEVARHQFTATTSLPSANLEMVGELQIGIG